MNGGLALVISLGVLACGFGAVWWICFDEHNRRAFRRDVLPVAGTVAWRTLVVLARACMQIFKWTFILMLAITIGGFSALFRMNTSPGRR